MNVQRPSYVPLGVRVLVAARQVRELNTDLCFSMLYGLGLHAPKRGAELGDPTLPLHRKLRSLLFVLFGERKFELHHRPALVNRRWIERRQDYEPRANDPDHLFYVAEDDHDVETRVRGLRGQHSDLGLRRKLKNIEKNRAHLRTRGFTFSSDKSKPKMKSRPLRSGNRLPGKGQRPFNRRNP